MTEDCGTCRYQFRGPDDHPCSRCYTMAGHANKWQAKLPPAPTQKGQPMPNTDVDCSTCIHWTDREDVEPCLGCLAQSKPPINRPFTAWASSAVTDPCDAPCPPAPATPSAFDRLPPLTQLALVKALVARVAHRLRDEGIGDGSYAPVWRSAYQAYEEQTGDRVLRGPGQYDRPASALDAIVASGKLSVFARIVTQVFAAEDHK